METLLGFHVGFWDYITFLVIAILVAIGLTVVVLVLRPDRGGIRQELEAK
jgi:preprotein translocase subunit SecG